MQTAWDNPQVLDETQKNLIWQCLPLDVLEDASVQAPKQEAELDKLQRVLAACDEISKYEVSGGPSWLTEDGKKFPDAIRSYVHCAASYFHTGQNYLPVEFSNSLVSWVVASRSHIATLNYDELLYRAFINTNAFNGYNCLLDGFVPTFSEDHLQRYYPGSQSYYLHLHGSPLYYTSKSGELCKAGLRELPNIEGHASSHLVLTEVTHKISVINASPILREYWRRLEEAMKEVSHLVLFGYGGGDDHLNDLVSRHFKDKIVEIVERKRPEYDTSDGRAERFSYWKEKLGHKNVLTWWLDNILEHRNWGWIPKENNKSS